MIYTLCMFLLYIINDSHILTIIKGLITAVYRETLARFLIWRIGDFAENRKTRQYYFIHYHTSYAEALTIAKFKIKFCQCIRMTNQPNLMQSKVSRQLYGMHPKFKQRRLTSYFQVSMLKVTIICGQLLMLDISVDWPINKILHLQSLAINTISTYKQQT